MSIPTCASPPGTPCETSAASTKPSSPSRSAPGTAATPASPTPTNTRPNSCNGTGQSIEPAQPDRVVESLSRRVRSGRAAINDVLGDEEGREGHTVVERVLQPARLGQPNAVIGSLLLLNEQDVTVSLGEDFL